MDRFINKNVDTNLGLDFLNNVNDVKNSKILEKKILDRKLKEFKKNLSDKIKDFNPFNKQSKNNKLNYMIKIMWIEFLTENLTEEKECELYGILDFNYHYER